MEYEVEFYQKDSGDVPVSGVLAATGVGLTGQIIGNAAISGSSDALNQYLDEGTINTKDVIVSTIAGGISGSIGGRGMKTKGGNYSKAITKAKGAISRYESKIATGNYNFSKTLLKQINNSRSEFLDVMYTESFFTSCRYIGGTTVSTVINDVL